VTNEVSARTGLPDVFTGTVSSFSCVLHTEYRERSFTHRSDFYY